MTNREQIEERLSSVDAFVAGGQSEAMVEAAERSLGMRFPATFAEYLRRWGNVSFDSIEYYGLTKNHDFENATVPNCVWFTLRKRKDVGLPSNLVVFRNKNDEEYICVELSEDGREGRMVAWDNLNRVISRQIEGTFFDFLYNELVEFGDI